MLCLALLAGWGLDDLLAGRGPARRALVVPGVVVLVVLAVFVVATGRGPLSHLGAAIPLATGFGSAPSNLDPSAGPVIRLAALLGFLVLGGAAVALVAWRPRGAALVGAACALVVVDLAHAGLGYNPSIRRTDAVQPATPAIRALQARRPERFVSIGAIPQDAIPIRFRLYEARGYDLPIERRFDTLWRRTIEPEFPSQVSPYPGSIPLAVQRLTPSRLDALRRLGVTRILQPPGDPPLHLPGVRVVSSGRDARLYAVERALPRAFVAGGSQAFTQVSAEPRDGTARISRYAPEHVTVTADARRAGLVVLTDLYYPGWKATVDGHDARIERVDDIYRGVRVGPGRHVVTFRYDPLSWRLGRDVTLLALAGLALAVGAGLRRRRRR